MSVNNLIRSPPQEEELRTRDAELMQEKQQTERNIQELETAIKQQDVQITTRRL